MYENLQFFVLKNSVPDPDPPDPHVFGPPRSGSGSTSQRYGSGSGSGSFYHRAKIVRKTLIPSILYFLNLLSVKPNCTRLLCPHCHLSKNAGNSLNLSVDVNVHY
jgi:hypothetical protein